MSKATIQLDTAIERFKGLLPEGLDTADLEAALRELIHGTPAVREAAANHAHLVADMLEEVKNGTATKENALFVLEMAKKGALTLGEAALVGAKKKAFALFIDKILAYLRKIWPGGV